MRRTSSRQAPTARLRLACQTLSFTDAVSDAVGRILSISGTADVADAAVALAAVTHHAAVLTSDPAGIVTVADAMGTKLPLIVL